MSHSEHENIVRPAPLDALGWNKHFAHAFAQLPASSHEPGLAPARVVRRDRTQYLVEGGQGIREARAPRVLRLEHDPAVGDWVAVHAEGRADEPLRMAAVLPRTSAFVRAAAGGSGSPQVVAANIDIAIVVTSPDDLNARRLERYVALAWESGAQPLVVIAKADACDDRAAAYAAAAHAAPGVDVLVASSHTGEAVDELERRLAAGTTAVLIGSSGVGKSTLANTLLGADHLRTRSVRRDGRGRHTTTHRELLRLPHGGVIIDTPGMRELALWFADTGLDATFAEIDDVAVGCRFRDCTHRTEPGCAVQEAVENGAIEPERLDSMHRLRAEIAALERRNDPEARAEYKRDAKSLQRLGRELRKMRGR